MHPIAFFGGLKAGGKIVHLSPLDAERELMHKLKDSGARILVTTNFGYFLPNACKMLDAGLIDLVIVAEDAAWGPSPIPPLPLPDRPGRRRLRRFRRRRTAPPARWPAVDARRCRAAAIYRRHDRRAQRRYPQPRQSDRRGCDL